ncbi:MAG: class I poly(R)-hydroxyalkanoic acid synthase [Brachymonas sp.]|nr:class I poly(R)-hydroxyalkanoic acid synthase [Brachymonas sp.]
MFHSPFMPNALDWLQALPSAWAQAAQAWQQTLQTSFPPEPNTQSQGAESPNTAPPHQDLLAILCAASQALGSSLGCLQLPPARLKELQAQYVQELIALWQDPGKLAEIASDRRFASPLWQQRPVSGMAAAMYLLNSRFLLALADALQGDEQTCGRVRFAIEQWVAAAAPSNFWALNVDAQHKALQTGGASLARGVHNLLADARKGSISMTDERPFEVGRSLALSEGAVVFENEIFQLIEYKPLTPKVHERPLLLIPACINKYYILDLQPDNSLVRFTLEQGHHTFILSWRNPDASMAHMTWDDYIEHGIITAMHKVLQASGAKKLNVLGFCVGGTMLATALAVLAARKQPLVHSATFLTCLLDFRHAGVLGLFIDEGFVRWREKQFAHGGLLPGRDLLNTFSFLRPNELVWNYVADNYLKGETPRALDLLFWNGDSTNLPGPWYAWYLRNTYLENRLIEAGAAVVCGEKIDLGKIKLPVYLYGSREDHIVPIEGAYTSAQVLSGCKRRFVMGASGHIAGVINPVKKNRRNYWTNDDLPATLSEWMADATEHPGSWWADWAQWLGQQGGRLVASPKRYGNGQLKPIEPAPGSYVKAQAKPA